MDASSNFDGLNRKEYADLDPEDFECASHYDYAMLKYDGIWCRLVIANGQAKYYSRTNNLKHSRGLTTDEIKLFGDDSTVLIGEFMYGQEWAQALDRKGKFFAFDVVKWKGVDTTALNFMSRYRLLTFINLGADALLQYCMLYQKSSIQQLWKSFVLKRDYEGLVLIKSRGDYTRDLLGRMKKVFEDDVFIVGFEEGSNRLAGTLGGCLVATVPGGEPICTVGGGFSDALRDQIWASRDSFLGKCMTITSNKRFESGSLRSPNFLRWHGEK